MRNCRIIHFVAMAAVCVAMLFEAREAAAAEQKKIQFLTMQLQPEFDSYINDLIARYEKSHSDVKVEWLDYPAQDYEKKLLFNFMGQNAPDVINVNFFYGVRFAQRKVLLDLKDYTTSAQLSRYFPRMLTKGCSYRGEVFGLPWYLSTDMMMYNKEIFKQAGLDPDKPPHTNQEMVEYARVIKEKTGIFGFLNTMTEEGTLKGFLCEEGVELANEEMTKSAFNTPEGVRVLKFWADVYKEGLVPREALHATHRRPIELFKTGQIAMFQSGPQFLRLIRKDALDIYKNVGVGPRIRGKNPEIDIAVMSLAVSKDSKHPREAVDFALFVTNGENQLEFCKQVAIFPSVIEAAKDPYFMRGGETAEAQARKIGAEQLGFSTVWVPPLPDMSRLDEAMNEAMEKAALGKASPEDALTEAAKKWDAILERAA
ncbi:MAG: sugar ABC transporter substrate-binding protein, partial [bacterium]